MKQFQSTIAAGALAALTSIAPAAANAAESTVQLTIVNPNDLYDPAPYGYSHAVVAKGGSRIAYLAGQGGEDLSGDLSPSFDAQVKQAYRNLNSALAAVGGKPDQVTKLTTYVVDYDQSKLSVMTRYLKQMFGNALPAQSLVPVPRLALDGMLFEVDAVAILN